MVAQPTSQPDILEVISDLSNDEVFTPPKVACAVLDLLPDDVWADSNLRWLDPGCKTGVFLREITRRLMVGLEPVFPDEHERLNHILQNMVFGIAITELTALMTRRTLYCSKDPAGARSVVEMTSSSGKVWMQRIEHSYVNGRCAECPASSEQMEREGRENHAYGLIHAAGRAAFQEEFDMKFDVIVGNPPYQMDSAGNTRTMPIYDSFVSQARALDPRYISMIIPARWMAGGLGLTEFRAELLGDKRIRQLVDFPDSSGVFPGVDIKGGICFFLWDRDNPGKCMVTTHRGGETVGPVERKLDEFDVLVRDYRAIAILKKVLDRNEASLIDIVSSKRPFGLRTNFRGNAKPPKDSPVTLYRSGGKAWVSRNQVESNTQWIDEWKVLIPKAGPGSSGGHVLPDMVLGRPQKSEPGSCCTETFIVVGPIASEAEADSLSSYLKTRFVRFLVSLRKVSQDAPKGTYRWVPKQDWSSTWGDEELYKKYGITKDEQAYIAEMIREMPE